VALQVPAGVLVDTFGVRPVILLSQCASAAGTLLFVESHSLPAATVARFLVACGDALVFTSLIKLVSTRFPIGRFGLMSGLSQVSGYLGGVLATVPLALAVVALGWRPPFIAVAIITLANAVLLAAVLPPGKRASGAGAKSALASMGANLRLMGGALGTRAAWGCAGSFAAHFVAVTTLTAAWGSAMLMNAFNHPRADANLPLMCFMAANVVGSVLLGWLVDRLPSCGQPLVAAAGARSLLLLALCPAAGLAGSLWVACVLFSVLGLIAGGTLPLVLRVLREAYTPAAVGVGLAINLTLSGLATAVIQALMGWVFRLTWDGTVTSDGPVYTALGYDLFMALLVAVSLCGLWTPLLLGVDSAVCARSYKR
jgi:MFS family permease